MRLINTVVPTPRDHVPHASSWIVHIPTVSRNDVNVQVWHRLPGSLTDVESNVVGVGMIFTVENSFGVVDSGDQGFTLFGSGLEPGCDVSVGNQEGMALAHREGVPESVNKIGPVEDSVGGG